MEKQTQSWTADRSPAAHTLVAAIFVDSVGTVLKKVDSDFKPFAFQECKLLSEVLPAFSPLRHRHPVPGVPPAAAAAPAVSDRVPLDAAEHVAETLPELLILQCA